MSDIEAIKARHEEDDAELNEEGFYTRPDQCHLDRATLLTAITAAEARAEAAEARVKYLQIIIDCVVANCEASASSYQERIETIHRVTSALALEWDEDRELKGPGQ